MTFKKALSNYQGKLQMHAMSSIFIMEILLPINDEEFDNKK